MKFSQLPLGQRFELAGETYVKAGPLTARQEADGSQKMIPRSAEVAPLEPAGSGRSARSRMPNKEELLEAFEHFERECRDCLDELASAIPPDRLAPARQRMDKARQAFLDLLHHGAGLG